jgi:hypothetical protein
MQCNITKHKLYCQYITSKHFHLKVYEGLLQRFRSWRKQQMGIQIKFQNDVTDILDYEQKVFYTYTAEWRSEHWRWFLDLSLTGSNNNINIYLLTDSLAVHHQLTFQRIQTIRSIKSKYLWWMYWEPIWAVDKHCVTITYKDNTLGNR